MSSCIFVFFLINFEKKKKSKDVWGNDCKEDLQKLLWFTDAIGGINCGAVRGTWYGRIRMFWKIMNFRVVTETLLHVRSQHHRRLFSCLEIWFSVEHSNCVLSWDRVLSRNPNWKLGTFKLSNEPLKNPWRNIFFLKHECMNWGIVEYQLQMIDYFLLITENLQNSAQLTWYLGVINEFPKGSWNILLVNTLLESSTREPSREERPLESTSPLTQDGSGQKLVSEYKCRDRHKNPPCFK